MISNLNYIISLLILLVGLYGIISSGNLIKKLLSMCIFQSAILLFFISMGKVRQAHAPFLQCAEFSNCPTIYSNPIPQVLMLTAIVVGVATLAVGLSLVINIKKKLGTTDEHEIEKIK